MRKRIRFIIIIILCTMMFELHTPKSISATGQECCPDIAIGQLPELEYVPYLGKCVARLCYECWIRRSRVCEIATVGGIMLNCKILLDTGVFTGYHCRPASLQNNDPGQACNENTDRCFERRFVPKTTQCNGNEVCANTAIGLLQVSNYGSFLNNILRWGIGIGGGLTFLGILWGSFKITTAEGNPDKLNEGKEIITSAIVGVIFLILSLTILQIIGINILNLRPLGF